MTELPTVTVLCPYCWQPNELIIDPAPEPQSYIEDCQICCRPMVVDIAAGIDGEPHVEVHGEDE